MDVKEQIALSILKGAGGDVDKDYTSTNAIYKDVESIYKAQDNRQDVESLQVELIDNGTYTYDDRNTQGYKPVEITVNVPVEDYYNSGFENGIVIQKAKLEAITITENGIYNKEDGYDEVEVNIDTQSFYDNGYNNGTQDQKSKLESITITENGIYNKEDGYNNVDVNIDTQSYYDSGYNNGYSEGDNNGYERGYDEGVDNGIQEQKSKLESITIEANGTYIKEDGYNEVKVALDIPKTKIYNGFRFVSEGNNDYKRIKDIDFSLYDWSGVYELDNFFEGFESTDGGGLESGDFDNFVENFDGEMVSCYKMFNNSNALKEAPNFGDKTKNCLNMSDMFGGCSKLTNVPYLNTGKVTDMSDMFEGCDKLTTIPLIDTGNVTNMNWMFNSCVNLTSIPLLDTSNVTRMIYMFNSCVNLTSIPLLDTSKVTDMSYMFYRCRSLTTIPQLDTSKVTNMSYMFYDCHKLTSIPQLDTSRVTDMSWMFYNSSYNPPELSYIPLIDCGNVTKIYSMFGASNVYNSITDLGGFKDLGKQKTLNGSDEFLKNTRSLTHESLMNVINNLYDRKANGLSNLTLGFSATNLNKLTDEEKTIAINKGWILS